MVYRSIVSLQPIERLTNQHPMSSMWRGERRERIERVNKSASQRDVDSNSGSRRAARVSLTGSLNASFFSVSAPDIQEQLLFVESIDGVGRLVSDRCGGF